MILKRWFDPFHMKLIIVTMEIHMLNRYLNKLYMKKDKMVNKTKMR